ncbi:MAG TPA: amino acid adenylation domain-containing protein [Aldersonia sp.]
MTSPPADCYRLGRTIHEVFRARARANPRHTALIHRAERVDYGELDARSDQLAAELVGRGVGPGRTVPVLLPRSPLLVAVLLAVLKTGAAYAAFDPAWPRERVARLVRKLGARLVVTEPGTDVGEGVTVWSPGLRADWSGEPIFDEVGGDDAACVFFTSGSTGEPKGALSPHAGTVRLFVDCPFAELGSTTVMPQAAPLPWDGMTLELWAPLLNGGTAVLADQPYLTPPLLRDLVAEHGVDTVWLTASIFNMAIEEDPDCFAGLRQVLIGGERLSVKHVAAFLSAHPGIRLVNGYGPVESTVFVTTHRIRGDDVADSAGIPVGRAVPRTELFVLDGERVCAPGELGEICVAGDGLALRYVADPATTAEQFGYTTLNSLPTRIYRTGDCGLLTADGTLYVHGRMDRQVKIHGHRVEPAEVESALMALTGVARAVVEPRRNAYGAAVGLVGFYTAQQGLTPERLRAGLLDRLPPYLVPAQLREVEQFPYTPSGKIDHAALLAQLPAAAHPVPDRPTPAPGDDVRAHVTAVFADLLGIAAPPADTSFFALGGGSLDAGRACIRLGERLSRPVPLSAFMSAPTVDGLVAVLSAEVSVAAEVAEDPEQVEPGGIRLTPLQEAFWTVQNLRPADLSGHCHMLWWIDGPLETKTLRVALGDVHGRHESLRARYVLDAEPVAILTDPHPEPEFHLLPDDPDPTQVENAVLRLLDRPLDLAAGLIWRAVLQRCGADGRWLLGIVVHHVAFDGRSERLLADELSRAYRARLAGNPPRFEAPAPGLYQTAAEFDDQLATADLPAQAAFWRSRLAAVSPIDLPVEPSPRTGRDRMTSCGFALDGTAWQALTAVARAAGTTVITPALAAWAETLRDATGQSDFGIGIPVDKRSTTAMTRAVGCFVGMSCVPAAGLLSGSLDKAASTMREVLAAQDVPLVDVVRMTGRGSAQLYQTILALQHGGPLALTLSDCTTAHRRPSPPEPLCDVLVELWPTADGTAGGVDVELTTDAARIPDWLGPTLAESFRAGLLRLASG